jgi:imidazoleglycerol-phosphate dehydratase
VAVERRDHVTQASPRKSTYTRDTRESQISVAWDLDGTGQSDISTGLGMFDHLLDQLARHGLFDITVVAKGDLHVDPHHTIEDAGIALGRAFTQAVGDAKGIVRMADALVPLDEALAQVAVDVSRLGERALVRRAYRRGALRPDRALPPVPGF